MSAREAQMFIVGQILGWISVAIALTIASKAAGGLCP